MNANLLNRIALVLSYAGVFVSGVLSLAAQQGKYVPCGVSHGCEAVANHPSSKFLGVVPNAFLGLGLYLIIAIMASVREMKGVKPGSRGILVSYLLTTFGFLYSMYLTYVAITEIRDTCNWCLASAGVFTLLFVAHALLFQADQKEGERGRNMVGFGLVVALPFAVLIGVGIASSALTGSGRASQEVVTAPRNIIIPANPHIYGNPNAKVTIVEFGDLVCAACRQSYPEIKKMVDDSNGRMNMIFREYPLDISGHEMARPAAIVAEIMGEKGKFHEYVDAFYKADPDSLLSLDSVFNAVTAIGGDLAEVKKRYEKIAAPGPEGASDPAFLRVNKDKNDGRLLGFKGTPSFIILAEGLPMIAAQVNELKPTLEQPQYQKLISGG